MKTSYGFNSLIKIKNEYAYLLLSSVIIHTEFSFLLHLCNDMQKFIARDAFGLVWCVNAVLILANTIENTKYGWNRLRIDKNL